MSTRRYVFKALGAAVAGTALAPLVAWAQEAGCTDCVTVTSETGSGVTGTDEVGGGLADAIASGFANEPEVTMASGVKCQRYNANGWYRCCTDGCSSNCDNYGCQWTIKTCGQVRCVTGPGTDAKGKLKRRVRCYYYKSGRAPVCDTTSSKCCDACKTC